MSKYASSVVKVARSMIGIKEGSAEHKRIVDEYNSIKPLPVGYKLTMKDSWCAATVTVIGRRAGCADLIPAECGCERMIELCKSKGILIENENYTPKPGDIAFYDWQDDGKGDNRGWADHVGVVISVSGSDFQVVEGNYSNSVKVRNMKVNGKNLRCFASPKYDAEPVVNGSKPSETVNDQFRKHLNDAISALESLRGLIE